MTPSPMTVRLILVASVLALPAPVLAGDRELLSVVDREVPATASASQAAAGGRPSAVQAAYDRARSLQEGVRAALPVSAACHALAGWTGRYAAAEVGAAEAFDRLQPARARSRRAAANGARARVSAARRACRVGPARRSAVIPALVEPRPYAASFGSIVARVPRGADAAVAYANGRRSGPLAISGGLARASLTGAVGRFDLEVRFTARGAPAGIARSAGVWLLPASASGTSRVPELDAGLQAQIAAAARGFDGAAGVWIHDLRTGRAGSWNAGAAFPAASTVKLGVMVEALRRMGPQPDASALFHDVRAIGAWSSNLAANRLLGRVGGSAGVQRALRRMGATSSTYTGNYIPATERPPVAANDPPPRVSGRVTTAADLGTVMRLLHEAAAGVPAARRATGLSGTQARLALGLLLASEQAGDNRGILRDALGPGVPAAQKQGWISSARHSAAVVYREGGPVVIVALTYRRGLTRAAASALGTDLVRIAPAG